MSRRSLWIHAVIVLLLAALAFSGHQWSFLLASLAILSSLFYIVKLLIHRRDAARRTTLALRLASAVLVFAAGLGGCHAQTKLIERRLAPVITALADYRKEHGAYPETLGPIASKLPGALPDCKTHPLIYFTKEGASEYVLTCVTYGFNKHLYRSEKGAWEDWD